MVRPPWLVWSLFGRVTFSAAQASFTNAASAALQKGMRSDRAGYKE